MRKYDHKMSKTKHGSILNLLKLIEFLALFFFLSAFASVIILKHSCAPEQGVEQFWYWNTSEVSKNILPSYWMLWELKISDWFVTNNVLFLFIQEEMECLK